MWVIASKLLKILENVKWDSLNDSRIRKYTGLFRIML